MRSIKDPTIKLEWYSTIIKPHQMLVNLYPFMGTGATQDLLPQFNIHFVKYMELEDLPAERKTVIFCKALRSIA